MAEHLCTVPQLLNRFVPAAEITRWLFNHSLATTNSCGRNAGERAAPGLAKRRRWNRRWGVKRRGLGRWMSRWMVVWRKEIRWFCCLFVQCLQAALMCLWVDILRDHTLHTHPAHTRPCTHTHVKRERVFHALLTWSYVEGRVELSIQEIKTIICFFTNSTDKSSDVCSVLKLGFLHSICCFNLSNLGYVLFRWFTASLFPSGCNDFYLQLTAQVNVQYFPLQAG